jgi:site-specific DNA-methyltransferase (adenine-specific)/modification methylase
MAVDIETTNFEMIPLDRIISRLSVRRISASGVARLQESMKWAGFLENYPLTVIPLEDGYQLIDGNHRYEAAKGLGIASVPCVIKTELTEAELYQMAMQSNNAAETVVPSNLVTYAEFIWARLAEEDEQGKKKYTQSDVGKMLGWDREKIKDHAALRKICTEAWHIIGDTFEKNDPTEKNEASPGDGDTSPFTVRLLQSILPLTPEQQTELVKELTTNPNFSKGKFKTLADNYRARNEMKTYALEQIGTLGEPYTTNLTDEIDSGGYDADWKQETHPKLQKLIASLRDEWQQKNSIRFLPSDGPGDFYEQVKNVPDGSIDLIITDPPFNIATDREFNLEGRNNRSQDFGEWDKHDALTEFRSLFFTWATEWKRILRDQGSGYVFCSYRYVSYLHDVLMEAGLNVKGMITWYKTNPGPQIEHVTFRNSCEHIIFFIKGKSGHTFNWQGENEMHDHIAAPICLGKERVVDAKGEVLHPTQKPVSVLKHLIQISSNRGDKVFDGFAGVGSTGAAAKELKRKFIGIEKDDIYFAAMQRRLADG